MVAAAVVAEMIGQSSVGVRNGYLFEGRVATGRASPKEKLQIHHIIYNDGIDPAHAFWLMIPRTDSTYFGIETGGQRGCTFY